MKVLHHNDADGRCAAFWVKQAVEDKKLKKDFYFLKFYEMDYNKPVPFDEIKKDETVLIVDFSIKPDEMDKLLEKTSNVYWIDHHISAIKDYKDYKNIDKIKGIRYSDSEYLVSGAGLVYLYFYEELSDKISPDIFGLKLETAPKFTQYISDFDVWKFKYGSDTKYFFLACEAYDQKPDHGVWDKLFNNELNENDLINEGKIIQQYLVFNCGNYQKKYAYEAEFEGEKILCLNRGGGISSQDMFGMDIDKYKFVIAYCFNGKQWTYSIYSTDPDVDVSVIAKKYGGGGHKGASGFSSDEKLV
jgi:oligoribonuclease NrnB/cAMP/cGMP phosphodiesterase (DHH superfamily)